LCEHRGGHDGKEPSNKQMILLLVKKKKKTDSGRLREKLWRSERRFQERKKVEPFNLSKNLLTLDTKIIICEFERKSSGKGGEVNRGSGGRRNC